MGVLGVFGGLEVEELQPYSCDRLIARTGFETCCVYQSSVFFLLFTLFMLPWLSFIRGQLAHFFLMY